VHSSLKKVSPDELYNTIVRHYSDQNREYTIFDQNDGEAEGDSYVRFLIDRKHVIEYRITVDRGMDLAIPSVAIGPHYFPPVDYWDYRNSQRFSLSPDIEALKHNLSVLDDFLRTR